MKNHEIGFTHLYNAMSGNDHRSPGVLSAALSKGKYAEIICDNIHVSKEAIKIAKKCFEFLKTRSELDLIGFENLDIFAH